MNSSKSNNFALSIASVVFIVLVVIGVFYVFSRHIVLVNVCSGNETLIALSSGPSCYPNIYDTVIANGTPYSLNSSIAVSGGKSIPLDFRFIGDNPLLYIWNQNETETGSYAFLTIPDTFKVHMQYTSSVATEFIVMTSAQYVQWVNSGETSNSNVYSITGTSISVWFNDSAGCAGYVAVVKAQSGNGFTIYPNETALYDPASKATGVCA